MAIRQPKPKAVTIVVCPKCGQKYNIELHRKCPNCWAHDPEQKLEDQTCLKTS